MADVIRITSKKDGFRRCGIDHPSTPKEYPAKDFNKEQLKRLEAEPMLVVEKVKKKKSKSKGKGKKKKK